MEPIMIDATDSNVVTDLPKPSFLDRARALMQQGRLAALPLVARHGPLLRNRGPHSARPA